MGKGVSETFNEHEQDTAPRGYDQGMVESAKRTAKISRAEIEEALRTESGMREAVTREEIARHVESMGEVDAHSRPTIDVFRPVLAMSAEVNTPSPSSPALATAPMPAWSPVSTPVAHGVAEPTSSATALVDSHERISPAPTPLPAPRAVILSRGALITIVTIAILLLTAASATGFFFARRLPR